MSTVEMIVLAAIAALVLMPCRYDPAILLKERSERQRKGRN